MLSVPRSLALALTGVLAGTGVGSSVEDPVDFATQVRPLLEARCHECHGATKQKAGLRLDLRAAALAGSYGGEEKVILPGDSTGSLLYRRVAGLVEGEDRMPPKGAPLAAEQAELLRRWIDEGASWSTEAGEQTAGPLVTHWAYQPPVKPELPAVRDEAWCRAPLDRFVLARLEAEGLTPSPEADRETLLRRVTLDLTGLPPPPEEIDLFSADEADDAYERVVDRLLASPAWAEHMARGWLDLARYADSNGYEKDDRRVAWRWRDWVIEALDGDMPFDEFTLRQLAGDLLPDATLEDRVATGFHRNTMVNLEGGVDPEEFRVAAVIDRVNTTATVWLGTTLACAQCHSHKYDPLSHEEYFRFYAFFDSTADTGSSLEPQVRAPTEGQLDELERLEAEVARLEAALEEDWPGAAERPLDWEARARAVALDPPDWSTLLPLALRSTGGAELVAGDDGVVRVAGPQPETDAYELELEPPSGDLTALRLEALQTGEPAEGPGRAAHANFVLTGVELGVAGTPVRAPIADVQASFEQEGYPARGAIDGNSRTGWAVGDGERARTAEAVFVLREPLALPAGGRLRVVLRFESRHTRHALGLFRLTATTDAGVRAFTALPADVRLALALEPGERDGAQLALLRRHWRREVAPEGVALAAELDRALAARDAQEATIPTALVMSELATPRETRVHLRGSFLSPGERVEPGVPGVLNPMPADASPDRLGLARWLVDPANPLTARVAVNRAWERLFGRGLVATSDDFGTRGEPPTHPALLDWLALAFVEDGWSLKRLYRGIVTSATYRQASRVRAEQLERDPHNLLLARAPRLRLEAEVLRDCALAAAGLLDRRRGGPSVFPPQPEGIWASTYSGDRWSDSRGGDRWRRGLYTFLKRTSPYPTFVTFDGTSRELTCTRRPRTNTPLQALTLLNDPVFVEAALGLARRTMLEVGDLPVDLASHAFRLVHGRWPVAPELDVLVELYEAELERYRADPQAARALTTSAVPLPIAELPTEELAAWTVVANVLLNTDGFVTRE